MYYNIIANVKQRAVNLKSSKPQSGYTWNVHHNIIYNCGTSFSWNEYPVGDPGFLFQHNISINPTRLHLDQIAFQTNDDHAGVVMLNNQYYPDGDLFDWANVVSGFSDWRIRSGKGQNSKVLK